MGRYFALTIDLPQSAIQIKSKNKKTVKSWPNFGFWALTLLVVLGIVYLIEVNGLSTKGYEIKKLEAKLLELKESHARLELEAAALKSIQNLEATVKTLNLVPSKGVNYLKGLSGYAYEE